MGWLMVLVMVFVLMMLDLLDLMYGFMNWVGMICVLWLNVISWCVSYCEFGYVFMLICVMWVIMKKVRIVLWLNLVC